MAAATSLIRQELAVMKSTQSAQVEEAYQRGLSAASNRPVISDEEEALRARDAALLQFRQQGRHQAQLHEFNYEQPRSSTGNNTPLFSSPLAVQNIKVTVKQSSPSASITCAAMNGQIPCLAINNSPFVQFCERCRAPLPRDRNYYKY